MDEFGNPLMQINDFELDDFVDDPIYDREFIDLIGGEKEDPRVPSLVNNPLSGCDVDNQLGYSTTTGDIFGLNGASPLVPDLSFVRNSSGSSLDGDEKGRDHEEDQDGGCSSGANGKTTASNTKKSKVHQERTLISERKRRGKMKEKLYQLRALVPNITKMDKASIVGDAVLYIQELQTKAKKLKTEIAGIDACLAGSGKYQESRENAKKTRVRRCNRPVCKKIMQMDVFQVEERSCYFRLVCNKGEGVAVSLYKALESLTSFKVQISNLATFSESFVLTLTLNVKDSEQRMHLRNLELCVVSSLLNQGFEL